jgi:outer membrane protein assembly factor BamB
MNLSSLATHSFRHGLLVAGVLLLSGCSWLDSLGNKDEPQPAELTRIEDEVRMRQLWSVNVGDGQGEKFNRLKPHYANGTVYAASNDGVVIAVDAETGRMRWRQRTDYVITGGVGFGNDIVLVGTENSQVVAFSAEDGSELWATEVSSEVLAAPATNGRYVVVQSVDGNLTGLDAATGAQRWTYENTVPALSLRGTSAPLIVEGFVIAAMANGTVSSIAIDNGTLRWEERVSIPTGRSEIDRLIDIDGDLVLNDAGLVLAPSYQGYFAAIDAVTGQTRWRNQESSYVGASFGFGNLYLVDDQDLVKAYRAPQETTVWETDALIRRQLSAPLGFSNYVAVADFEGYVHLLSQVDGRLVGRARVDRKGVRARMVNQGNTIFVLGNSGKLAALSVQ